MGRSFGRSSAAIFSTRRHRCGSVAVHYDKAAPHIALQKFHCFPHCELSGELQYDRTRLCDHEIFNESSLLRCRRFLRLALEFNSETRGFRCRRVNPAGRGTMEAETRSI